MRYAEVAVDAPIWHNRAFTYSVPHLLDVRVGQVVRVPFGTRTLQGLVLSIGKQSTAPHTRPILSVFQEPVLTRDQLSLAMWISDYYMSSVFDAAALMFPPGRRLREKIYLTIGLSTQESDGPGLTTYQQKVLSYISSRNRVDERLLIRALGYRAKTAIVRLSNAGLVVRTQELSGKPIKQKTANYFVVGSLIASVLEDELKNLIGRWPRRAALLGRLTPGGASILASDARKQYGNSAVKTLLDNGWIVQKTVVQDRDPLDGIKFEVLQEAVTVKLTYAQNKAASAIAKALSNQSQSVFLLEGVTGSGKTEVYLDAVKRCFELGKKAIVLVPEIALTHQTIERFAARFPGDVAVLHSGLSAGERFDQWWKIHRGEYGVVIGSRGAVFAPQPDLGLIVIDEEHEWTYKQHDSVPRYHARDVAIRLAKLNNAVVLLGSASPDVSSYSKALTNTYQLLRMPDRLARREENGIAKLAKARLAKVDVIDMRRELREGNRLIFSRALMEAMKESLEFGSQVLLFLNRRGSASFMQCRRCGFSLRCRRCDISVSYHRDLDRLICHYCGDRRIPPSKCPECLGHGMTYRGIGTKAVVDELESKFLDVKVLRWDSDTAKHPRQHRKIFEDFRSGAAQILVGTQMIAKGLHFPNVNLVGVISADLGLNVPDFRAGERTFQLLCQVAGRSGRGMNEGRVIVQSFQPNNYSIKAASIQNYPAFYEREMSYRVDQGNPPIGRLVQLLHLHKNQALCEKEARRFYTELVKERDIRGYSDIEIMGPTPAHPSRLRGHYRWQLVLRAQIPRKILESVSIPHGWTVDVDPMFLS